MIIMTNQSNLLICSENQLRHWNHPQQTQDRVNKYEKHFPLALLHREVTKAFLGKFGKIKLLRIIFV